MARRDRPGRWPTLAAGTIIAVADLPASPERIFHALILAHGEATPMVLARELPLTRQAISKHLVVLDRAGLIQSRRGGREVRHAVDAERLAAATRAMTRVAAQWDQRLQAIKRVAEAVHHEHGMQAQRHPG